MRDLRALAGDRERPRLPVLLLRAIEDRPPVPPLPAAAGRRVYWL